MIDFFINLAVSFSQIVTSFKSIGLMYLYWYWFTVLVFLTDIWKKRHCGDEALFSNKYHGSVHASQPVWSLLSRILRSSTLCLVFQTVHPSKSSHRARIGTGGVPRGNELDTDITVHWWPWQETWDVIIRWHLSTLCILLISKLSDVASRWQKY